MVRWGHVIGGGLAVAAAAGAAIAAGGVAPALKSSAAEASFFEARVRPVLVARCYSCHSAESKPVQGGLRVDSREALLKGGPRGPSLVPGHPESSRIIQAVRHESGLIMPPVGKMSEGEIAALTSWVKQGAPWPEQRAAKPAADPKSLWAYKPPLMPALPPAKDTAWAANPIDRFIRAGLDARKLTPAPPADRRTLIRRATFDLTGLPPTPQEVRDFVGDARPEAFARVVDRLLASPAYGERWGRHWLDVARYADSNGVDENLVYPNAWRYRDYVIRAFNQDKPIDRFIQEQIAGDLLADGHPDDFDRVVATGYLSLGPKMLAEDDPVKQEEDIIDEQIDTLGKTFMGLTLGCARCHDHKFDPFPQTDYYALAGIFKSTRTMLNFKNMAEWQELPLIGPDERKALGEVEERIRVKRANLARRRETAEEALLAEAKRRSADYVRVAREISQAAAAPSLKPILAADAPAETAPPAGGTLVEAEDFSSGNVLKDREGFGKGIGVLVNAGQYPNRTEYTVTVPAAGAYQLDLRYASGDPRPIRIFINEALVRNNAAGEVTGGFYPQHQRWFAEVAFLLKAGPNVIRFERDSYFPHVDKLLLTPTRGNFAKTLEQRAAEENLVPEFLTQAGAQLKAAGSTTFEPQFEVPDRPDGLLPRAERASLAALDAEIRDLEKQKPDAPRAMAATEATATNVKVHLRGNYLTLGQDCPRGVPALLTASPLAIPERSSGRLELARWLTRPDHPLTSRVFVNRVWRWHFGRGLVGSTDNFGKLGETPSNPALLDWLAVTLQQDGWSLKKLHRRIMLSRTYQMSSRYDAHAAQADPENRLRWHWDRQRLDAEALRDAILFATGDLDRTMGGTLLKFKPREYVTSTANADPVNYTSNRRSVYLPVIRSALYDVYTAFDFGDPTVMNGDRPTTTVAPQALFLMNSPLVLAHTRSMALKLLAMRDLDDAGRVQSAYETCFGRGAAEAEVKKSLAFVERVRQAYASEPEAEKRSLHAWQSLVKALLQTNEFIYLD